MQMNSRTKRSSSGDKFSFPVINQDSDEFEFTSPNSPADRFFSNGKLLPHAFPVQTHNSFSYSRSTSIGSKDSLMSSRSNSRSSTSTSARTSTSEASERRRERSVRPAAMSCQCQSRRWQLIAAAPVLKHHGSRSTRTETAVDRKASRGADGGCHKGSKSWFKSNFLKSFVSACQECHAIKT
ncbi:uncharacterized protein LOC130987018 [Salvia miltiorrhiza]|uniref:uncharacterized protein LOC130987018 n=1 Tax=Salvia miltiorrhiza TaxID=226208 RepID=UPI0025AD1A57|nr:uncharacterized protein LOC130987018 [Salvia miltiorrhiza]